MIKNISKFLLLLPAFLAFAVTSHITSDAHAATPKRSEAYFMTRAERAARITCAKEKTPARTRACRSKQMSAARRIVRYIRRGNKERRLKKTLGCLQRVQVLPRRLRRRGMLWVEKCAK